MTYEEKLAEQALECDLCIEDSDSKCLKCEAKKRAVLKAHVMVKPVVEKEMLK
ncbi:MAG: hypothetical protein NWF07_13755 [Candidatus Bathyarchaeota archaeon]|nr:hypothetical protein [Candidatus Bathyarchaeota archaeon]